MRLRCKASVAAATETVTTFRSDKPIWLFPLGSISAGRAFVASSGKRPRAGNTVSGVRAQVVSPTSRVIKEYLEAYSAQNYRTQEFRQAKCGCGSEDFELLADDDEGCAKRICASCRVEQFICDSGEYWPESTPEKWGNASSVVPLLRT